MSHLPQESEKVRLAITLGDPAGIGPETVVGAWALPGLHEGCDLFAVGRPELLERAIAVRDVSARVEPIDRPEDASSSPERICCLSAGSAEAAEVPPATVDARGGRAAYDALVAAAELALEGRVDGIVTAPLNKVALKQAGYDYPGHTELLAELCGVDDYAMMLYLPPDSTLRVGGPAGLGVVHVTLHMALSQVVQNLTTEGVVAKIRLADAAMRTLGVRNPRIGVAALNPHAGEQGLFGDEEQRIIEPAVNESVAAGYLVSGPFPADTLMIRARDGEFDAVVAMYHDQGHIALKLLGMHDAVNVTLGLPIVRTSVAHGTAFDQAWKGTARTAGMLAAVRTACRLAQERRGMMNDE